MIKLPTVPEMHLGVILVTNEYLLDYLDIILNRGLEGVELVTVSRLDYYTDMWKMYCNCILFDPVSDDEVQGYDLVLKRCTNGIILVNALPTGKYYSKPQ